MANALDSTRPHGDLHEVATVFLRLGCTAFGGPAAHIAMMRQEFVERRRWLTEQEFLDLFGAANLIPGPSSTELAILLGYRRAGWRALILAGALFILPAMLLVFAFAWAYVRYGSLPAASALLYGVKPTIIAIIGLALWRLRVSALKGPVHVVSAGLAALLLLTGSNPLPLLFGGGLLVLLVSRARRLANGEPRRLWSLLPAAAYTVHAGAADLATALQSAILVASRPATLFLTFLKIGAIVYGSGYVLLAFLRADFVTHLHWLTNRQLLDAVAVGQFTPGPVFTTATFIGYLIGGWGGGLLATLGIFLPSFIFCPLIMRLLPLAQRRPAIRETLDGVNAAALGLMAAVTMQLARAAVVDLPSALIAAVSLALLLRFGWNSAWFVLAGALTGFLIHGGA